jgi:hypothetical protein
MNYYYICKKNESIINTFIGKICKGCDKKTNLLAKEKLKTWKLPTFTEESLKCI